MKGAFALFTAFVFDCGLNIYIRFLNLWSWFSARELRFGLGQQRVNTHAELVEKSALFFLRHIFNRLRRLLYRNLRLLSLGLCRLLLNRLLLNRLLHLGLNSHCI